MMQDEFKINEWFNWQFMLTSSIGRNYTQWYCTNIEAQPHSVWWSTWLWLWKFQWKLFCITMEYVLVKKFIWPAQVYKRPDNLIFASGSSFQVCTWKMLFCSLLAWLVLRKAKSTWNSCENYVLSKFKYKGPERIIQGDNLCNKLLILLTLWSKVNFNLTVRRFYLEN